MLTLNWIGIAICLVHSGLFSGLNLGFFGLSRLRLEIQAEAKEPGAIEILNLRKDAHLLLATILWGNVGSNVLLTLLTDSVLTGVSVFLFSTFGITFFGEIIPQAYFSKHALRASRFVIPFVRFYQIVFFPIAKPTALLLDHWWGQEKIRYFRESELMIMLSKQAQSGQSDMGLIESLGAINFMKMDDIVLEDEGCVIDPQSIISLPDSSRLPVFPQFKRDPSDPFLQQIYSSGHKWIIVINPEQKPVIVLNAYRFLKDVLYGQKVIDILHYCHRPIVVTANRTKLGEMIARLRSNAGTPEDDVIEHDLILLWGDQKRIITGADILGRLLRGIAKRESKMPKF